MPAPKRGDITLSKPGDWLDWYDGLLDFARDHELEELVDIETSKPVSEILLPKPEKPNPLVLFPRLLNTLPPEVLNRSQYRYWMKRASLSSLLGTPLSGIKQSRTMPWCTSAAPKPTDGKPD
jgi:hypothetical protein